MDPNLVPKNFWVNLTVVLPGMVTYGTWRLVIFYTGYDGINFEALDKSLVLTLCVLFAVAFLQQAFGIAVEAVLTGISRIIRKACPSFYMLFVGRFSILAKDQLNERTIRTLGQFFLSLNLAIGQGFVLLFAYAIRAGCERPPEQWLFYVLGAIITVTVFVACFRCWNAIVAVQAAVQKNGQKESG